MDPQVTWTMLLDAYEAGDAEEFVAAAKALRVWLDCGGFPPLVLADRPMDDRWNAAIARAACEFVLGGCSSR